MPKNNKKIVKTTKSRRIIKIDSRTTLERAVLKYVNIERKKRHLPPYFWNLSAVKAARRHSQLMIRMGIIDHVLPGESEVKSRVIEYVPASIVMENIGASCSSSNIDTIAREIVYNWVWDDASWNWGHRHNVLDGITSDPGYNNIPADFFSNPYGYHNYGMNHVGIGANYGTLHFNGQSCRGWVVTMDVIKIEQ